MNFTDHIRLYKNNTVKNGVPIVLFLFIKIISSNLKNNNHLPHYYTLEKKLKYRYKSIL